ncbi:MULTISPECIES: ROK family protein [Amycolatopsis]|uniref:Sugar kinase of the NBD/HSP70 family, may contain an N-terminal HTH domain n=2 Tax=Amycolatopsis TaxID=1813 RepID=A0A1I3T8R2_9PSEU|nr:ROK family protein [Amycolatopsis sacchari]SFJ66161.1 Sugar kinase of the NBD/HSP70 family, may contain an N-terminal HTH domain [Amycolatopsis sacchari]
MDRDGIRRRNVAALLRSVHLSGGMSRAGLARELGLNRSTILALTAELTEAGLIREELPRDSHQQGRPSLVVLPESERIQVLAFDVAVDHLVAARIGLGGVVLDRVVAPRARAGPDLEYVVDVLARLGRQLHRAAPPASICVGAGASYCGMIEPGGGTVRFGPDLGWVDQEFGAELSRALGLGLPVRVGNEAHLGAVAEQRRGAGAGLRNLIYLHGDVGVGGGIIAGGKLLDGETGYGCEVGHIVVNPVDGRPCGCGSRGCLEAEVGERALLDAAGRPADLFGREAVRAVVDDAGRGDPAARDALRRIGDWLGIGVANLINLFNPGMVVFGGMLRDVYPAVAAEVRGRIVSHVLPVARERVRLGVSALGDDATLIGAGELAFAPLLDDPLAVVAAPPGAGQASAGTRGW